MEDEYISKAVVTTLKFTSRASIKIKESYYTVEACEERAIPDIDGVDLDKERELLWETVNNECDSQIQEIVSIYKD